MNGQSEFIQIWYVGSPGALVSNLFKSGRCDLILRFYGTMFIKHILNFFFQNRSTYLLQNLWGCSLGGALPSLLK